MRWVSAIMISMIWGKLKHALSPGISRVSKFKIMIDDEFTSVVRYLLTNSSLSGV